MRIFNKKLNNQLNRDFIDCESESSRQYSCFRMIMMDLLLKEDLSHYLASFTNCKIIIDNSFHQQIKDSIRLNFDYIFPAKDIINNIQSISNLSSTIEDYSLFSNELFKKFIYKYDDILRLIVDDKYYSITKGSKFYDLYKPVINVEFIIYIINITAKSIRFEFDKNSFIYLRHTFEKLVLKYFEKVIYHIRINEELYDEYIVDNEIFRLKRLTYQHDSFKFLDSYINQLKELREEFNNIIRLKNNDEIRKFSKHQKNELKKLLKNWFISINDKQLNCLIEFDETIVGDYGKEDLMLKVQASYFYYLLTIFIEKQYLSKDRAKYIISNSKISQRNSRLISWDSFKSIKSKFLNNKEEALSKNRESDDNLKKIRQLFELF